MNFLILDDSDNGDEVECMGNFSQTPEYIELDDDEEESSLLSSQQLTLEKIKDESFIAEPLEENDEKRSDPSDSLDEKSSSSEDEDEDLEDSQQALYKKILQSNKKGDKNTFKKKHLHEEKSRNIFSDSSDVRFKVSYKGEIR